VDTIIDEITNMSKTLLCLDCKRSITFLYTGERMLEYSRKNIGMDVITSIFTYVRCNACIDTKGRLPKDGKEMTCAEMEEYINTRTLICKSISNFMNIPKESIKREVRGPGTWDTCSNIDEIVDAYMIELPCLSLDKNSVGPMYRDFLETVYEEIPRNKQMHDNRQMSMLSNILEHVSPDMNPFVTRTE
jgi:hypothetical protein